MEYAWQVSTIKNTSLYLQWSKNREFKNEGLQKYTKQLNDLTVKDYSVADWV